MECKYFRSHEEQDISTLSSIIAESLDQYHFDGFVLEFGFADSILPILYDLREMIGEKDMILVVHPQSCISIAITVITSICDEGKCHVYDSTE